MTLREIYEAAVQLICEDPENTANADYEERASYILPTFLGQCAAADAKYRLAHGLSKASPVTTAYLPLSKSFSLSDVFVAPATYYLAAMLTVDENEELSERFFALYSDALASILDSLPADSHPIADRYAVL